MKVMVLGGGVIGVTTAYYLARAGARGHGGRPPERRRAGNQLRQRRRGVARLFGALGRARRAAQGDPVDADAAQPAGDLAAARPGHVALGRAMLAQLHRRALCSSTRAAWCRSPSTAATACSELRADTGIALRRAHAGHAAAVPHAEAARRHGQGHRGAQGLRRALRGARPRRLRRGRAGAGAACARQVRRRAAPARRRDRRLPQVHAARWPTMAAAQGVRFRFGTRDPRPRTEGGRITGVTTDGRQRHRPTRYVLALGSYSPLLLAPLGPRMPVYPVKGYSITLPIIDPAARAASPPSWTRPTRSRSRGSATASASAARPSWPATTCALRPAPARHAGARGHRPVPRRRRRRASRVLVRPAPDDARRHADHRRHAVSPTCCSPPATARSAGPWPAAPAA